MSRDGYFDALATARMVVPSQAARGITTWRERGMLASELLLDVFATRLGGIADTTVVEHPMLVPAHDYRDVFGHYGNVIGFEQPHRAVDSPAVLRPDNLHLNVDWLRQKASTAKAVVAKGGVTRSLKAGSTPLFRDSYIWPAIQGTQLANRHVAVPALHRWRRAVEATFAAIGLPAFTVEPVQPPNYGRLCWLVLSCLPDGSPTVLATLYLMNDRYRQALKVGQGTDVIDVGFTGKALAVAAMHHRDHRGLAFPSTISPTQVGFVARRKGSDLHDLYERALSNGIRAQLVTAERSQGAVWRAQRILHRLGTPIVVSDVEGRHEVTTRLPLLRRILPGPATVELLRAELDAFDQRLAQRSSHRSERGAAKWQTMLRLCADCAAHQPVRLYGWAVTDDACHIPCARCCRKPGRTAVLLDAARLY